MIFVNLYIQSIYNKYFSKLTTEERVVLELWCKVNVCHTTLHLLIWLPHHHPISHHRTYPLSLVENQHTISFYIKVSYSFFFLFFFGIVKCHFIIFFFLWWWWDSNPGKLDYFHELIQSVYIYQRSIYLYNRVAHCNLDLVWGSSLLCNTTFVDLPPHPNPPPPPHCPPPYLIKL